MMKPILFNGEMVRAILSGQKTQTRRPIKPQPEYGVNYCFYTKSNWALTDQGGQTCSCKEVKCPYEIGDVLYVRETFCIESNERIDSELAYDDMDGPGCRWKPSIHMPRWAARLFLEVTDVRAERVRSISEDDCLAEGVERLPIGATGRQFYMSYSPLGNANKLRCEIDSKTSYSQIWNSIYKNKRYVDADGNVTHINLGWEVNPWVWVFDFKIIEKPEEK